jgi:Zn-dependent protease with chaperone function
VLHSALLDSLPADELRYALGQQLGHIQLGHTRAAILLGGDHSTLPAVLGWVAQLRDLLFAWYRRTQVTSADRAGVLACGSVGMAIRAQVKLSVGSAQLSNVQGADILQQASTLRQRPNRIGGFMVRLQSTTPPLIPRLEAMVEWAGMPEPNQPEGANGKA